MKIFHVPKVFRSITRVSRSLRTHSGFCLMVSLAPQHDLAGLGSGPEGSWQAPFRHTLNTTHLSHVPLCLLEQMFTFAQTHLCFYQNGAIAINMSSTGEL